MWPTKNDITQILVENIVGTGKKFEDLQDSWFTKHLVIALREAMWVLILMVQMVYKNLTVRTAAGNDLDDKGYDFGVDRKEAVKAVHMVTLHKSAAVAYDLPVPDGFLLSTTPVGNHPPVKFVVMDGQNLFIPQGQSHVSNVKVVCVKYGLVGNVSANAINLVAQAGFDRVSDSRLHVAGAEKEEDGLYRERILARKRNPARAGVPADWERWALEMEGVTAARCFRCARGPGTADVVIWGENGEMPSEGLIEKCQAYLEEKYMPADLADGGILAAAPEEVAIDIMIANTALKTGYTKEMVQPVIERALNRLFAGKREAGTITVVDCIVCIRTAYDPQDMERAPLVEDFILLAPDQNIPITGRQSPVVGRIAIEVKTDG